MDLWFKPTTSSKDDHNSVVQGPQFEWGGVGARPTPGRFPRPNQRFFGPPVLTLGKWNEHQLLHRLRMTMRFADFVPRYRNARFFAYYEVVQSMDTPENSTADCYVLHVISDGNQDLRKSLTQASIGNSGDFQSTQVD